MASTLLPPQAFSCARIVTELDRDPVVDVRDQLLDMDDMVELLRTEQFHVRRALAEPDVSFIVVPTETETHPVRAVDGVIKDATALERAKARLRRV